jgi:hypothetical protein
MPNEVHVDLIPTAALADEWGVDVRTIHRMVARGELKPFARAPGPRGAYLFRREDVAKAAA